MQWIWFSWVPSVPSLSWESNSHSAQNQKLIWTAGHLKMGKDCYFHNFSYCCIAFSSNVRTYDVCNLQNSHLSPWRAKAFASERRQTSARPHAPMSRSRGLFPQRWPDPHHFLMYLKPACSATNAKGRRMSWSIRLSRQTHPNWRKAWSSHSLAYYGSGCRVEIWCPQRCHEQMRHSLISRINATVCFPSLPWMVKQQGLYLHSCVPQEQTCQTHTQFQCQVWFQQA